MTHHLFVEPDAITDGTIVVGGDEGHHAAHALRLRPGETVTVADGTGTVYEARVSDVGEGIRADIVSSVDVAVPRPAVTLVQAVPKGDRFDHVVEKATELGVHAIVPFMAERTIVRWDAGKRAKAVRRWEAVTRAAAKQSRAPRLVTIADIADGPPSGEGPTLVLDGAAPRRLRQALPVDAPEAVSIVVGPEGGLSPGELASFRPEEVVSLGSRVLRTETAGPVAAALVAYAYGSLG